MTVACGPPQQLRFRVLPFGSGPNARVAPRPVRSQLCRETPLLEAHILRFSVHPSVSPFTHYQYRQRALLSCNAHNSSPGAQAGGIFFFWEPMPFISVVCPPFNFIAASATTPRESYPRSCPENVQGCRFQCHSSGRLGWLLPSHGNRWRSPETNSTARRYGTWRTFSPDARQRAERSRPGSIRAQLFSNPFRMSRFRFAVQCAAVSINGPC